MADGDACGSGGRDGDDRGGEPGGVVLSCMPLAEDVYYLSRRVCKSA